MKAIRISNARDTGALVRRRRKQLKLDQSELAERLGVSRAWLIKVEKGHPNAQISLIFRLFNYLDISIQTQIEDKSIAGKSKNILDQIRNRTLHLDEHDT